MKKLPSDFMIDLMDKHEIKGFMALVWEDENGELVVSHAEREAHEINIPLALATFILDIRKDKEDNAWNRIIRNSAETIVDTCETIKDLAKD